MIQYRPISTYPGTPTPSGQRRRAPFSAGWSSTTLLLRRELDHLRAKDVVLELALREQDIRLDGVPRAGAPQPDHPGVVVSFESMHGPLRYATDVFDRWQDNMRAIALGLEALRRVERYGIVKRGEQYVGWKQIEAASQSVGEAREILFAMAGWKNPSTDERNGIHDEKLIRRARAETHPDRQPFGDRKKWDIVEHAAETLGVA